MKLTVHETSKKSWNTSRELEMVALPETFDTPHGTETFRFYVDPEARDAWKLSYHHKQTSYSITTIFES